MSMKWPGGLIRKTPVTPAGPYENGAAPGMWTMAEAAYWKKQGLWPIAGNIAPDPYFPYVSLLLPGNGTNGAQNNTFLDSSTNNFTITRVANTTQGSFSAYGPNWSNYFDGSGDFLRTPGTSGFNLTTDIFTVECWFMLTGDAIVDGDGLRSAALLTYGEANSNRCAFYILGNASTTGTGFSVFSGLVGGSSWSATLQKNVWYHVAFVRDAVATTIKCYLNGVSLGAPTGPLAGGALSNAIPSFVNVGRLNYPNYVWDFNGFISNLRLVRGTAIYTTNFTPPTAPLSAVSGTSILTCQSNRFIDNSGNNLVLTSGGDIAVQRFSPFSPSGSYSSSTIGGSAYLDGVGDYLATPTSTAFDLGGGNFTVEGWYYWTGTITATPHFFQIGSGIGPRWNVYRDGGTGNYFRLYSSAGGGFTTTTPVPTNTWFHLAVTKSGSTTTLYLNGVSIGSSASTVYPSGDMQLAVGTQQFFPGVDDYFAGWVSNFRVVKGTAVYTAAFTPPTAPVTAVTNTQLLLNFTNAGIVDSAMQTDLETVGNVQISTTQSKFGGSSIALDGSADVAAGYRNYALVLGRGSFTWECWVYLNSIVGTQAILSQRGAQQSQLFFGVDTASGGQLFAYADGSGSPGRMCSTNITTGQWHHVALVRNGNTVTIYLNGVGSSTATSTQAFVSSNVFVGADDASGGAALNGYIDDLRITNGIARYTTNFTPPASAFATF